MPRFHYPTGGQVPASMARSMERLSIKTDRHTEEIRKRLATQNKWTPAKLVGFDSSTRRFSWVEQAIDENGSRYDKPGGIVGSASYLPARAYGDGTYPTSLPAQVTLRQSTTSPTLGVIYEFPWYCACGQVYSGSGSGSGGGSGSGSGSGSGGSSVTRDPVCTIGRTVPRYYYGTMVWVSGPLVHMNGGTVRTKVVSPSPSNVIYNNDPAGVMTGSYSGVNWTFYNPGIFFNCSSPDSSANWYSVNGFGTTFFLSTGCLVNYFDVTYAVVSGTVGNVYGGLQLVMQVTLKPTDFSCGGYIGTTTVYHMYWNP